MRVHEKETLANFQSPDVKFRKKQQKSHRLDRNSLPSSQSSTNVPATIRKELKLSQNNRCWLCDRKALKSRRTLEIAYVLSKVIKKRRLFEHHHKCGRLQLSNIRNAVNLIALCSVCHFALDAKKWTFLPNDMTTWL